MVHQRCHCLSPESAVVARIPTLWVEAPHLPAMEQCIAYTDTTSFLTDELGGREG